MLLQWAHGDLSPEGGTASSSQTSSPISKDLGTTAPGSWPETRALSRGAKRKLRPPSEKVLPPYCCSSGPGFTRVTKPTVLSNPTRLNGLQVICMCEPSLQPWRRPQIKMHMFPWKRRCPFLAWGSLSLTSKFMRVLFLSMKSQCSSNIKCPRFNQMNYPPNILIHSVFLLYFIFFFCYKICICNTN